MKPSCEGMPALKGLAALFVDCLSTRILTLAQPVSLCAAPQREPLLTVW
jgi:hypothetical protein